VNELGTKWTNSFASKTGIHLEMIGQVGSEEGVEGRTFDMIVKVVSDHLVQQFGHALDNRRLEHTARVSPDSGLYKST